MKKKVKGFFDEFKKFITRGNVLDMSVGVIVGSAFTAIVNGLSNFILKPIINFLLAIILGKDALSELYTMLKPVYDDTGALVLAESIYLDWGAFINAVINFFLIAFVLFCLVRAINNFAKAREKWIESLELDEKKTVAEYRRAGLTKKEAWAKYTEEKQKLIAEKAEQERLEKEKAEQAKREAEEKAMANTRLLEEIRDLLKNK